MNQEKIAAECVCVSCDSCRQNQALAGEPGKLKLLFENIGRDVLDFRMCSSVWENVGLDYRRNMLKSWKEGIHDENRVEHFTQPETITMLTYFRKVQVSFPRLFLIKRLTSLDLLRSF